MEPLTLAVAGHDDEDERRRAGEIARSAAAATPLTSIRRSAALSVAHVERILAGAFPRPAIFMDGRLDTF
jgi:hypothetical protein